MATFQAVKLQLEGSGLMSHCIYTTPLYRHGMQNWPTQQISGLETVNMSLTRIATRSPVNSIMLERLSLPLPVIHSELHSASFSYTYPINIIIQLPVLLHHSYVHMYVPVCKVHKPLHLHPHFHPRLCSIDCNNNYCSVVFPLQTTLLSANIMQWQLMCIVTRLLHYFLQIHELLDFL